MLGLQDRVARPKQFSPKHYPLKFILKNTPCLWARQHNASLELALYTDWRELLMECLTISARKTSREFSPFKITTHYNSSRYPLWCQIWGKYSSWINISIWAYSFITQVWMYNVSVQDSNSLLQSWLSKFWHEEKNNDDLERILISDIHQTWYLSWVSRGKTINTEWGCTKMPWCTMAPVNGQRELNTVLIN